MADLEYVPNPKAEKEMKRKLQLIRQHQMRLDAYQDVMLQKIQLVRNLTANPLQTDEDIHRATVKLNRVIEREQNDLTYYYNPKIGGVPTW